MDGAEKWYVVHTYSGYENTVSASIMKAAENRHMEDLVFEVKIPTETVTEHGDNGDKTYERKLFPGYVLVKMIMTDESWHLVRNARGCTGFVSMDGKPVPLTEDEVFEMGVERQEVIMEYGVGSTVRVCDGPLEGFLGTVEEMDTDKDRVRVILSMFGRETPVDLELDQIEKVEED